MQLKNLNVQHTQTKTCHTVLLPSLNKRKRKEKCKAPPSKPVSATLIRMDVGGISLVSSSELSGSHSGAVCQLASHQQSGLPALSTSAPGRTRRGGLRALNALRQAKKGLGQT